MRRECRRTWGARTAAALAGALFLALPAGALAAAGDVTEFPIPTPGAQPEDLISGGDGNIWVTESQAPAVLRITPAGVIREFQYTGTNGNSQVAVAQDGNVWFGTRNARVGRIKPLGAIRFFGAPTTSATIGGLGAGIDGNLWIAEGFTAKIGKLGPGGLGGNPPAITEVDAPQTITDVAAGIDGALWFTEGGSSFTAPPNTGKIGRITTANAVTEYTSGLSANSSPERIAAGHDGNLWFTERSGNRIGRVTTATGAIQQFTLPAFLTGPEGIAAGPDGNMWFAAAQGIGRITPAGVITVYADNIDITARPYGIAAGPDGYMWFTELNGNKIGRIATDVVPPTSGNLLLNPGFEQGTPISSNAASGPVPGWTTVPSFSAADYGASGLPAAAVGTQVGGGSSFGWGGTMSANIGTSWALQHVDVAREAAGIDGGRASVTLSGLLGGIGTQQDNARVKALFLSATGDGLGSAEIGPVTAADRQNQTTLLRRSASAALPPGTRAVRVVATSTRLNGGSTNDGLFDNLALTMDVAPAPAPAGGGTPAPAGPGTPSAPGAPGQAAIADTTAPSIASFSASPAKFAVAAGATAVAARKTTTPRGTTLKYGVSEAATVTLTFERATQGRRAGSRCVKATSRNRRAKRCTLYVAAGTLTRNSPVGVSTLQFTGRIGRKALTTGGYRITAVATDAAGNKSSGRQIAIKVVKP